MRYTLKNVCIFVSTDTEHLSAISRLHVFLKIETTTYAEYQNSHFDLKSIVLTVKVIYYYAKKCQNDA